MEFNFYKITTKDNVIGIGTEPAKAKPNDKSVKFRQW
jgi:hypothetical protein